MKKDIQRDCLLEALPGQQARPDELKDDSTADSEVIVTPF